MTFDRAELRKRAEAASAGDWHIRHDDEVWIGVQDDEVDRYIAGGGFETDSLYIVATQPSTVLALLDRIEELEGGLSYAAKGLDMVHNGLMDPTRPRQAVGEVCNHFLEAARKALSGEKQ